MTKTTDGLKEYSPRNVLTLLREAQRYALNRPDIKAKRYDSTRPLLDASDLDVGWKRVSDARLEDTLFAEFNELRSACERFRNGTQRLRRTFLLRMFQESEDDVAQLVKNLRYAGFLEELSPDLYEVADIYVPALNIRPGTSGAKDVSNLQKSSPRPVVPGDSTIEGARVFLDAGDYESAVAVALGGRKDSISSIVFAADAALRSGNEELLGNALDAAKGVARPSSQVIARTVALELALNEEFAAIKLVGSQRNKKAELVCHHLIAAFRNSSSLERTAWKTLLGSVGSLPPSWDYLLPVTAGSRMLAVSRSLADESEFTTVSDDLLRYWWPSPIQRWSNHAAKISHALANYLSDSEKGRRPSLLPYQVVSLWSVLGSLEHRLATLESSLMIAAAKRLRSTNDQHRQSFRDWAEIDGFAQKIARHAGMY